MRSLLLVLLLATSSARAGSYESSPLTTTDIAEILGLKATRSVVRFDQPQELEFRYDTGDVHHVTPLGKHKTVTLLIYSPSRDGGKGSFGVTIYKGDKSSISTYFPGPPAEPGKSMFTKAGFDGDVFSIQGSLKEDFSKFAYRFQILPGKLAAPEAKP